MSFILDALRKSEKTRRQSVVPDLQTIHIQTPAPAPRRALWPWVLLVALVVNAAALLWVFKPWEEKAQPLVSQPLAPQERPQPSRPAPASIQPVPAVVNQPQPQPTLVSAPKTSASAAEPVIAAASQPKSAPPPAPQPRIYALGDLPGRVRERVPTMHFSMHYYTQDPKSRLVRINDRIMREGAMFEAGLRLEEITQEGVVFSTEGYKFTVSKGDTAESS